LCANAISAQLVVMHQIATHRSLCANAPRIQLSQPLYPGGAGTGVGVLCVIEQKQWTRWTPSATARGLRRRRVKRRKKSMVLSSHGMGGQV